MVVSELGILTAALAGNWFPGQSTNTLPLIEKGLVCIFDANLGHHMAHHAGDPELPKVSQIEADALHEFVCLSIRYIVTQIPPTLSNGMMRIPHHSLGTPRVSRRPVEL
jgi:hypothetical protein